MGRYSKRFLLLFEPFLCVSRSSHISSSRPLRGVRQPREVQWICSLYRQMNSGKFSVQLLLRLLPQPRRSRTISQRARYASKLSRLWRPAGHHPVPCYKRLFLDLANCAWQLLQSKLSCRYSYFPLFFGEPFALDHL